MGPSSHRVLCLYGRIYFRTSNGIKPCEENSVYLGLTSVVNRITLHSTVATINAIFLLADLGLITF